MKYFAINDFLDFAKQKYNIFYLLFIVYIIWAEIEYGYSHMVFGFFVFNNPISNFLLTFMGPTNLKFLEIWLKFNVIFFISYIFYYSKVEPPKDLHQFLVIKRNFYIYPLLFIYALVIVYFYDLLIEIQTTNVSLQSNLNFMQAFILVEVIIHGLFIFPLMLKLDGKWNLTTSKEFTIWKEEKFQKDTDFIAGLSAGFTSQDDFLKSKDLRLTYPYELKYFDEVKKGNFPTTTDYFNAKTWNITNYDDWVKSDKFKRRSNTNYVDWIKSDKLKQRSKKEFKESRNMFDFSRYAKFTLQSKFNIIFVLVTLISLIDYTIFINGFYSGSNYITIFTLYYYEYRWIILFGVLILAHFIYFFLYKKPETIAEGNFIKINSIVYPTLLLLITCLRPEIVTVGKPQYYMNLSTRILQSVMQPFVANGIVIFLLYLPLIVFSFYHFYIVGENQYYEYTEGNFVTYSSYRKGKVIDIYTNPDYAYELSKQEYLKKKLN